MSKIAVIRIRGDANRSPDKMKTLHLLNLGRKHNCVVLDETPIIVGMLKKVHDCVTWGYVKQETIDLLSTKRKVKGKIYLLNPPRKGFERKGIKVPYSLGGALGPRDNIDELIKRMI